MLKKKKSTIIQKIKKNMYNIDTNRNKKDTNRNEIIENNIFKIINFNDIFEINYKIVNNCNILIITRNDWSNTAFRFMKSIETQNKHAILIKLLPHKFNYPLQGIIPKNIIFNLIYYYPVIVEINNNTLLNFLINISKNIKYIWYHASSIFQFNNKYINNYLKNKINIVSHGGTTYREEPRIVGNFFNKFVHKTLIQCPDLLDLNENTYEELIYYPVDINYIKPDFNFKHDSKLVFGHNPSTNNIKGSKIILKILNKFNKYIITNINNNTLNNNQKQRIAWNEQLKKYKTVDIYIETLNPTINNKPYGEWGNTCLEAAASGCIVITNCLHLSKYIKFYHNNPPILIANNENELYNQIQKVINMSRDEILELKKEIYNWCIKYHSLQYCGNKLITFLNK